MRRVAIALAVAAAVACGAGASKNHEEAPGSGADVPLPPAPDPPIEQVDADVLRKLPDGGVWHAVVQRDLLPTQTVYAISDIHGGWDRVAALLASNGIIGSVPPTPDAIAWSAGNAILVVAGDLIDKGPQPVEVLDGLRALQASAAAIGGEVIVLLGNHEAEFFVDPHNPKATDKDGIDVELAAKGIDPAQLASGADPPGRGAWLRDRPLAARLGSWFFSHAGNTKGRTVGYLDAVLRVALGLHPDYNDVELVGIDSILEARDWYADAAVAPANAAALGVRHLVFGHDPNAIGPRGVIGVAQDGLLLRIDCGMSPDVDDSKGCILRVRREGSDEVAAMLDSKANAKEILRGAP